MKKSFTLLVCMIILLFVMKSGTVSAQWVSTGPEGGSIRCITHSGGRLFAVNGDFLSTSSLFSSADNGNTWSVINSSTFPTSSIYALTAIGNSLFVSSDGIYRSDDNGVTWVKKYNQCAVLLAVGGTKLYAAIQNSGILTSIDNGESWSFSNIGLDDKWFYSLAANETTVLAGTGDNNLGVYRSTDDGYTWEQVSNGMKYYVDGIWFPNMAPMITALAYVGSDLYAGTSEFQGIWKSSDNGDNWVFTGMETMNYNTVSAISGNESVVLAGSGWGIIRSDNGGTSWVESNQGIDVYGSVSSFLEKSGNTFVSTRGGIYKSVDNGGSWTDVNRGIQAQAITGFAVFDSALYVGAAAAGVFHSVDEGMSWNTVNDGLPINEWGMGALNSNASALFVWDRLSFDGGNTWEMSNNYSPGSVSFGWEGPRWLEHGNAWFAINSYENAGVYRSTDNGQNWTTITNGINNPTDLLYMNIYSDGPTLFLGTSNGTYTSTDNGDTWQAGSFPGMVSWAFLGAKFLSTGTSHIYGLADGGGIKGIYRSTDNGNNWLKVFEGLVTGNFVMLGADIFVSGWTKEFINNEEVITKLILVSHDDGQNWTKLSSDEINDIFISSFTVADSKLFFSTSTVPNSKVFCSVDNGSNWVNISDGLPQNTFAGTFFVNNNIIYTGTNNRSVWKRNLDELTSPSQPDAIVGSESSCVGSIQTYSVTNVPGITYTWQVPAGWVINSGGTSNAITVTVGSASGIVLVLPSNAFGIGPAQFRSVTVNAIPSTPVISQVGNLLLSDGATGNQWYKNDTLIAGATEASYELTANGSYFCIVTINGCLSDTSNRLNIFDLGIDKHSATEFTIYPVPNDGLFTILTDLSPAEKYNLRLINNLGIPVYELSDRMASGNDVIEIDARSLPSGMYVLQFMTSERKIAQKMMIHHTN